MTSEPGNPSESTTSPIHDSGTGVADIDVYELIEACLESFAKQAPLDDLSQMLRFIPEANDESQQFLLVELIKLDMSMAAENGRLRKIEEYVEALGDRLPLDSVPLDLVMEEIQLRKDGGEFPAKADYATRFERFDGMLNHLLDSVEATTSIGRCGVVPEQPTGRSLDDFLIIQKLGEGAFAHVYLARQISMQRIVALKVSRGTGDESQALAQFDHPNIVRVFDQRAMPEEQLHLLYMQFIPGGTLSDVVKLVRTSEGEPSGHLLLDAVDRNLLRTAQAVPENSSTRDWIESTRWPTLVAWVGVQLAGALADSHRHGTLHRDVKPANVLLTSEGVPKLADFNVSQAGAAGRAGAAATLGGSIGYMAPEHLRAISLQPLDERDQVRETADLYSLAILLWELWQGRRPFSAKAGATSWSDAVQGQLQSREGALIEPVHIGSSAERVLERTLRSALAYSIEDRFQNAAGMAGRMKLAMHPAAAALFYPEEDTILARIARFPPLVVAIVVILVPHLVAAAFNYLYNLFETMPEEAENDLKSLSPGMTIAALLVGTSLLIHFTRPLIRAEKRAREGGIVEEQDIVGAMNVCQLAGVISGLVWAVQGIVFSLLMWLRHMELTTTQLLHFCISFLFCGGVTMVYPFFGMALVTTLVSYPRMVGQKMFDEGFDQRAKRMMGLCERYLYASAVVPALGAALLVNSESQVFVLFAIGAALVGSLASFRAYRALSRTWSRLGDVLSTSANAGAVSTFD